MKKLLLFLFLVVFSFFGGLAAVRWNTILSSYFPNRTASVLEPVSHTRFLPSQYPLENRFFTVIVVGRNNGASVERTLTSIFTQNYENFRIVYIDDGSDDGSFELARDLIYDMKYLIPTTLNRNEESIGPLASLTSAIQSCSDEEIVVLVDGNDWLAHEWVLQKLNQYYADPDLWMTYGQFRKYPSFELGSIQDCPGKDIRKCSFSAFHLQTFYAALFKKIRTSDFLYLDKYFSSNAPLAYMAPMLEMADHHFQYIPDTLYIINSEVPVGSNKDLEILFEKYVRGLPSYKSLKSLKDDGFLRENEI